MGALIKRIFTIIIPLIILIIVYLAFRGLGSWRQGYSWGEMDWGQKGYTSIFDFFEASDIGKRSIIREGKACTEYYSYKDGMPIKTICAK